MSEELKNYLAENHFQHDTIIDDGEASINWIFVKHRHEKSICYWVEDIPYTGNWTFETYEEAAQKFNELSTLPIDY